MLLDEDQLPKPKPIHFEARFHSYFWIALILAGSYLNHLEYLGHLRWLGFGGMSGFMLYGLLFMPQARLTIVLRSFLLVSMVVFINFYLVDVLTIRPRSVVYFTSFLIAFLFYWNRFGNYKQR